MAIYTSVAGYIQLRGITLYLRRRAWQQRRPLCQQGCMLVAAAADRLYSGRVYRQLPANRAGPSRRPLARLGSAADGGDLGAVGAAAPAGAVAQDLADGGLKGGGGVGLEGWRSE
jgi:hypothetical protein